MGWDPSQYGKFAGPRRRPGLDLIARIPEVAPGWVFDLGCGSGELTALLAARWPEATVVGVDSSLEMLMQAATREPSCIWLLGNIDGWAPPESPQVIFSNAALHWVDDHAALFPRLFDSLGPGGVLAVQMPRNFDAPSHALMRMVASDSRWAGRIALRAEPVREPAFYYGLLAEAAESLEIWETEYLHVLEGETPVLDWVRGTALLPVLEALDGEELEVFLAEYQQRLAAAYPPDGRQDAVPVPTAVHRGATLVRPPGFLDFGLFRSAPGLGGRYENNALFVGG